MQSWNPFNQQPPLTRFSHRHINTPKRVHFSLIICQGGGISNQLVEIYITVHIVDIKGLSRVDACPL
jgi:hypothetical protein